jgi:hypothetical protein
MEVALVVVLVALAIIGWLLSRRRTRPEPGRWEPSSKQPRPRTPETLPASFVVADTETNGLSPDRHHIIEIAAVRVIDGVQQGSFRSLVSLGWMSGAVALNRSSPMPGDGFSCVSTT